MNPFTQFDPAANPTGSINTMGVNANEQVMIFNSSLSCLLLEFPDHTKDVLPPSWARDWIKESPISYIKYTTLFTLPISGQPVSLTYGTLYEAGEHVASVNGPLQYVYVVGNPGGVPVTSINTLTNTGNNPLSPVITIQPNDGSSPTFSLDNSGNLIIRGDNAGVLTALVQVIAGVSPSIKLGNVISGTPTLTEILGNLQIDNNLVLLNNKPLQFVDSGGTARQVMTLTGSNNVTIRAVQSGGSGLLLLLEDETGVVQLTVSSTTPQITVANDFKVTGNSTFTGDINGAYIDDGGTATRVRLGTSSASPGDALDVASTGWFAKHPSASKSFTYQSPSGTTQWVRSAEGANGNTTCGSGTVISHGLPKTPDVVLATPRITQPGSATCGVCSWTSTTFTCTVGSGSAVSWLAFNF